MTELLRPKMRSCNLGQYTTTGDNNQTGWTKNTKSQRNICGFHELYAHTNAERDCLKERIAMRFCWHARRYLLETVERPAPPVGLNEDPNIYSCRWVGSRKRREVKDLVFRPHKLEVRGGHKLFFS